VNNTHQITHNKSKMSAQQVEGKCWQNGSIFQSIKLIMEVSLSPPSGPPVIDICNAQNNFYDVLGYDIDALPLSLDSIISTANNEQDVIALVHAIQQGELHDTFLIICDAQGVDLACHVHVSLGGQFNNRISRSSADANGLHRDHFSVMTIRSASIVGNVKAINMLVEPSAVDDSDRAHNAEKQAKLARLAAERIDQNTQSLKKEGAEGATNSVLKSSSAKAAPKPRSRAKPKATAQGAPPPTLTVPPAMTASASVNSTDEIVLFGPVPDFQISATTNLPFSMLALPNLRSVGAAHNTACGSGNGPTVAVQGTAELPVRDCDGEGEEGGEIGAVAESASDRTDSSTTTTATATTTATTTTESDASIL